MKNNNIGLVRYLGANDRSHEPFWREVIVRVDMIYSLLRMECLRIGNLRPIRIPFADPHNLYTRALKRYVLDLCRVMTRQDVTEHLGMSRDTVEDMEKGRYGHPQLKRAG